MVHVRPGIDSIKLYVPGRATTGLSEIGELPYVPLASNESPFAPLPSVVKAIEEVVGKLNRYPDPGVYALREALAAELDVPLAQVAVGAGSMTLCLQAVLSTCGAGDELMFASPSYEGYPLLASVAGATAVKIPLRDGAHDLDAMAEAVTDRTRAIFICNPNNPTGSTVEAQRIERFVEEVRDDILILIDEAYAEFMGDPIKTVGLSLVRRHANVVSLRTFSKAHGLAGLRVGYLVGQPAVVEVVQRSHMPFNTNTLAQAAAIASLKDRDGLAARLAEVRTERAFVLDGLRQLGLPVRDTFTNFAWLDLGDQAEAFAAEMGRHGVLVRPLPPHGVRITLGDRVANERALATVATVLATFERDLSPA
ncbi:histidinol-phosphate transaminase [Actinomadura syzygii]